MIDRKVSFIGSMNRPSHQRIGRRRAVMIVRHGWRYAAHLLRRQRGRRARPATDLPCMPAVT